MEKKLNSDPNKPWQIVDDTFKCSTLTMISHINAVENQIFYVLIGHD